MTFWSRVKKFRIKDKQFQNVQPQTAYTMILLGMVHFLIIGSAFIDLRNLEKYNWGIFQSLGLADTIQIPLMAGLMAFDAFLMFYGVYLLKHLVPTKEEEDEEFRKKHNLDNSDNNNQK